MGYSNTSAQKQIAEKGDSFSGTNAQRKMGAVPVLQKAEGEEELQMKSALEHNSTHTMQMLSSLGETSCIQRMKWKYYGGKWNPNSDTDNPIPTHYGKKDDVFDDQIVDEDDVPDGYELTTFLEQNVLIKGLDILSKVHRDIAIGHLISGTIHHSDKMKGAKAQEPYLHTSKSDSTSLYLISIDGKFGEIPMYTIIKQGSVSGGWHSF